MDIFQTVKEHVTARQAAEYYGMTVQKNGMACCPFHNDKTPSMKLDERYYCFGCGATGDAVDLIRKLLGLDAKASVLKIAEDFGITLPNDIGKPLKRTGIRRKGSANITKTDEACVWIGRSLKILFMYRDLLDFWKELYAPATADEEWHPLFCEALLEKTKVDYLIDELLSCSKAGFTRMKNCCGKEVDRIGKRLEQYVSGNA